MSQHTIIISFTADVITLLEVEPRRLYFKNQECVSGEYKILSLKNTSKKTLNIQKIFDPTNIATVQLRRKIIQPGESVNAQVLGKPVGETSRSGEIVIRTDSKLQPELRVKYLIQGLK